jgi:hypothetical protein
MNNAMAPPMQIQIKKGRDGPDVLTCTRPDGTTVWKRLQPSIAVHDLVHFALETELGLRSGFYGLLEQGWSISDFESREARKRLPPDPAGVEFLVGRLWQEVFDRSAPAAEEFNAASAAIEAVQPGILIRRLDEEELERVRRTRDELVARWRVVPPGGTLELVFSLPGSAASDSPRAPR